MSTSLVNNQDGLERIRHACEQGVALVRDVPLVWWRLGLLLLAIVWLCKSLAKAFWLVLPPPQIAVPERVAQEAQGSAVQQGKINIDLKSLKAVQLFGDPSAVVAVELESEVSSEIPDEIATTSLNLTLQGVIASSTEEGARAIIGDGATQSIYKINDEVQRGVKLAKIFTLRVILDNKGKYESLWLYSEEDYNASQPNQNQRTVPLNRGAQDRPPSTAAGKKVIKSSASRDQLPKTIGDVVRFSVYREGGKMVGYRVRPGRDRALFDQVGLLNNDIVTEVNGIEISDPKKIREVYKSLRTATQAQLNVLRDGQSYIINISLDTGGN